MKYIAGILVFLCATLAAVPAASAVMACAGGVCAGTGPGNAPLVCRDLGTGTYRYQCVGVFGTCVYEWRDKEADGSPFDGDDWILTVICA